MSNPFNSNTFEVQLTIVGRWNGERFVDVLVFPFDTQGEPVSDSLRAHSAFALAGAYDPHELRGHEGERLQTRYAISRELLNQLQGVEQ